MFSFKKEVLMCIGNFTIRFSMWPALINCTLLMTSSQISLKMVASNQSELGVFIYFVDTIPWHLFYGSCSNLLVTKMWMWLTIVEHTLAQIANWSLADKTEEGSHYFLFFPLTLTLLHKICSMCVVPLSNIGHFFLQKNIWWTTEQDEQEFTWEQAVLGLS